MPPQAPVIDDEYGLESAKPAAGVTDEQYGLEPAAKTPAPKIGAGRQAPTRAPGETRPLSEEEVNKFLPPTNFEAEGKGSFAAEHPYLSGGLRAITTLGGLIPESTHPADYSILPGAYQAIRHPIESAKLIGEPMITAQKERFEKAGAAGNEAQRLGFSPRGASDALSAVTYAGEGIVPVIGPWIGGMADELESGIRNRHTPEGKEQIAHSVGSALTAGGISNLGGKPNATAEKVGEFVSPDRLMANRRMANFDSVVRDLAGKTPADLDFTQTLEKIRPDIAEIARKSGFLEKGNARVGEFQRMLEQRAGEIWDQEHKPQVENAAHMPIDHESVAQRATSAISKEDRANNPAAARAADRWIASALNPEVIGTVGGADAMIRRINAEVPNLPEPFKVIGKTVRNAAVKALRGELEGALQDTGEEGVKGPNTRWGALRQVSDAIEGRLNNAANKPLSTWETLRSARTPMVEGAIAGGAVGSLGGQEGAGIGAGIGAATGAAGSIVHDVLQQPGGRIARAMKGLSKTGLQPDTVKPGIPRLPGPTDTSGPINRPMDTTSPEYEFWRRQSLPAPSGDAVGALPTLSGPVTAPMWGRPIVQPQPGFELPNQELMGPWGTGTASEPTARTVAPMKPPMDFPPKGAVQEPLKFTRQPNVVENKGRVIENVSRDTFSDLLEVPKTASEAKTEVLSDLPRRVDAFLAEKPSADTIAKAQDELSQLRESVPAAREAAEGALRSLRGASAESPSRLQGTAEGKATVSKASSRGSQESRSETGSSAQKTATGSSPSEKISRPERRNSPRDVAGPDFYRTARMNELRKTIADESAPQEDRDLAQRQLDDMRANPFERHEGKDINQVKAMNKPTMTREEAEAVTEERKAGRQARFGEEGVLPGLGEHVAKQAEGAAKVKGEELTSEMNRPKSVEEAAGRMESLSPLFRGTGASPQNEMFRPGGEPVKPMEPPTDKYSAGLAKEYAEGGKMPVPANGSIEMPAPRRELAPTTKVLHTFNGEEGTRAEVAKIDKGFSVGLRDTDAGEMVGANKIYKTEAEAIAAAKELVKPPELTEVKGVTAKEPKAAKPKVAKPKPIDQRYSRDEILDAEGLLNTETGMMAAGDRPGIYYDEYSQEESPLKQNQDFRKGERAGGKWRGVTSGRDMHPFMRDNPDLNPQAWQKAVRNKDSAAYQKWMERALDWIKKSKISPEEQAAAAEKKWANFVPPKSKFVKLD